MSMSIRIKIPSDQNNPPRRLPEYRYAALYSIEPPGTPIPMIHILDNTTVYATTRPLNGDAIDPGDGQGYHRVVVSYRTRRGLITAIQHRRTGWIFYATTETPRDHTAVVAFFGPVAEQVRRAASLAGMTMDEFVRQAAEREATV